jgi:hypothetical protein
VGWLNSLLTGKITGNFSKLRFHDVSGHQKGPEEWALLRQIPYDKDQGIFLFEQGMRVS